MKSLKKLSRSKKFAPAVTAHYNVDDIAEFLGNCHGETIDALHSVIRHPRSLARPTPAWRPPVKTLPPMPGADPFAAAITRHRVGPRVKARMKAYGCSLDPAYLITVRVTSPEGAVVVPEVAEAWVRTVVGSGGAECVHVFSDEVSQTFVWMVDGMYRPLVSPASLFEGVSKAA